jgi:hypothetical protein
MAILAPTSSQNDRSGSGRYKPLKRNVNEEEKHFEVNEDLKTVLDNLDRASIRTVFKQASDPVHLAFRHIDKKSVGTLAKELVEDSTRSILDFVTNIL